MHSPQATTDSWSINRAIYDDAALVRQYSGRQSLSAAESLALLTVVAHARITSVLDLGVGAGRTIPFLRPLCERYECLDYSAVMVEHVRRTFPDVQAHEGDMRDLSKFDAADFDLVLASSNLIDAVSAADRREVLAGVRRALRPGGVFVFSSHNRRYRHAAKAPSPRFSKNPVTQVVNTALLLREWRNYTRLKPFQREEEDYALWTDSGHHYALLHYYTSSPQQERQLAEHGLRLRHIVDGTPRLIRTTDDDSASSSLHYIAQRID